MIQSPHDEKASSSRASHDGYSSPEDTNNVATHRKYQKTQNEVLKMLETETLHKETLSPFNPLPAIGQKIDNAWESRFKNEIIRRKKSAQLFYAILDEEDEEHKTAPTLNEVNLRNHKMSIVQKNHDEEKHTDLLKEIKENKGKLFFKPESDDEKCTQKQVDKNNNEEPSVPKLFEVKKRLLDRREREVFPIVPDDVEKEKEATFFKPIMVNGNGGVNNGNAKMNDLIEIFDSLQISRRYKEKVKKPNFWF